MAGLKDFPNNGALHGLKILDSGSNIAGPFAGGLLAEAGATVIHFEAPKKPDNQRGWYGYPQNHRNQLSMVADIKTEEGREIFLKLIKWADIWVESSKGGQYDRLGLPDGIPLDHQSQARYLPRFRLWPERCARIRYQGKL